MIEVTKALCELEETDFAVTVNVASDLRTFLRTAREQEPVKVLIENLGNPEIEGLLLNKLISLQKRLIDSRFENPGDSAMAVLVWLLAEMDTGLGLIAAQLTQYATNVWWARKVSEELISEQITHEEVPIQEWSPKEGRTKQCTLISDGSSEQVLFAGLPSSVVSRISDYQTIMRYPLAQAAGFVRTLGPESYSVSASDSGEFGTDQVAA